MQGYRETISFTAKESLACVTKIVGLPDPKYSNEVFFQAGLFCGYVNLVLPTIMEAGCGGETYIRGVELSNAFSAEESAAEKALSFLESNLKLTIVDLNYSERIYAIEKDKLLTKLRTCLVDAASRIKKDWSSMVECIHDGVDIFGGGAGSYPGGSHSAARVAAIEFCSEGLAKAHEDCVQGYEAVVAKIKSSSQFYPSLSELGA